MGHARAKSINLLLYEGDLNGVISIEDTSWNSGELYSAPRDSISELLDTGACSKYGVYLLLSRNMVYVGQSSDLAKRINQHVIGKDWWESVVILTTKDDSLNHSDIDYLESVLIEKALKINRLDCDNKNKGNPPKVDKFRRVYLGQYLEEALFLMQLIGISVFNDAKVTLHSKAPAGSLISTLDVNTKLAIGKRAKAEAIEFLTLNGIAVDKRCTYAVKKESKEEYWANPNVELLNTDWYIILNNNAAMELVVLLVPAHSFTATPGNKNTLFCRSDNEKRIDLNISVSDMRDRRTGLDFSPYVIKRIKY